MRRFRRGADRRAPRLRRPATLLRELERLLPRHGGEAAAEKRCRLRELGAVALQRASELTRLQRIVCFLSAFPDDLRVYGEARRLAGGFAERVAQLRKVERVSLDDSGAAGSCTRHTYAASAAGWLVRRHGGMVAIDWSAENAADAVAALVTRLRDPLEAEATDLDAAGLKKWLAQAGSKAGDLAWLLAQAGTGAVRRDFDRAFDAAEVPLAWRLDARAGITGNALRGRPTPRTEGMRHPAGQPCAAIMQPIAVERLPPRAAARLLDVWRAALWSRTRTVYQIEQPNLDECYLADLGAGLRFAAIGVLPARRGVLEATYGHLLLANGMPMGYGGFTTLFTQVNTGINVFPEFRGSEAAFAFEQALRVMHSLTGNARFVINPYQFGAGNDEALASGAYWFYYRLGFRSARAEVRALAAQEFARLRADRGYRVPVATLRKLAAGDLHLDLSDTASDRFFDEAWLQSIAAGITTAVASEGKVRRADALASLSQRIAALLGIRLGDWTALEQQGFRQWTPILAQIDDLAGWPQADRKALAQLVRARWATQEIDFVGRMREHDRLRIALARAAQP